MLAQVENDLVAIGKEDFLEYHIYLSRGWSADQVWDLMLFFNRDFEIVAFEQT